MKGDLKVIEHLNRILKNELSAINQYFLHSRILKDWGITALADYEYQESIDEMKHADTIIERILFLDGLPNLQSLNKLRIGENTQEIIECDLAMEVDGRLDLVEAIAYSESVKDYVSRDLFQRILESEEEHIDYLETQLVQIDKMGIQNYNQMMSSGVKAG